MASSAIDQLLQIIAPVRGTLGSATAPADGAEPFADHFGRASTKAEPTSRERADRSTTGVRDKGDAEDLRAEDARSDPADDGPQAAAADEKPRAKDEKETRSSQDDRDDSAAASNEITEQSDSADEKKPSEEESDESGGQQTAVAVQASTGSTTGGEDAEVAELAAEVAVQVAAVDSSGEAGSEEQTSGDGTQAGDAEVEAGVVAEAAKRQASGQVALETSAAEDESASAETEAAAQTSAEQEIIEPTDDAAGETAEAEQEKADAPSQVSGSAAAEAASVAAVASDEAKASDSSGSQETATTEGDETAGSTTETNVAAAKTQAGVDAENSASDAEDDQSSSQRDRHSSTNKSDGAGAKQNASAVQTPPVDDVASFDTEAKVAVDTASAKPMSGDTNTTQPIGERTLDRLAAAGRSVQPASNQADDTRISTADRARFVQRVGGALQLANNRGGDIQLRLSPPELGSLRLEVSVKQGVMTAKLETETAAAKNVLLDNLPALRERLAEQDIRIERFDVDVRRDGGQGSQNQTAHDFRHDAPHDRSPAPHAGKKESTATAQSTPSPTAGSATPTDDGLDVII